MRAPVIAAIISVLIPVVCTGALADPTGDQQTVVNTGAGVNPSVGTECATPESDIRDLEVTHAGDLGEVALTLASLAGSRPICLGVEEPTNWASVYQIRGNIGQGLDLIFVFGTVNGDVGTGRGFGSVCGAIDPVTGSCWYNEAAVHIESDSIVWTFPLTYNATPLCGCPSWDHRGANATVVASALTSFPEATNCIDRLFLCQDVNAVGIADDAVAAGTV